MPKNHTPPEPADSPILQSLRELSRKLDDAHGAEHMLRNKIAPTLNSPCVVCNELARHDEPKLPPIQQEIHLLSERVEELTDKIKDVTERAQC